ncbi:SDR family oxidoreductase [Streptomyces platensis]|uniref:SDR family oxidoreductase n=1 Tax=Streptomyces platensis TaxID=58346 RepID=UPI00225C2533|nr:SDR family oxidoreductase [Streptomyces platensis]MCX4634752.1 SDR family oxidoreductase [Streptomyces platensis]
MTAAPGDPGPPPRSDLAGQTVVVIGASAGIGLETARQVRAGGGGLILVGRNPERLQRAADELHPLGTAAFDANDSDRLQQFFQGLAAPVDHVMVTAGSPSYRPLSDMDLDAARAEFAQRLTLTLGVALHSRAKVRPGGTLLFMSGTGGRRPGVGMTIVSALTAALSALTANLALEMAPIRVNVIAAGFVDTPLSASLLGDRLEARRQELRDTLPIRRVVGPADVAALAVHLMCNDALTGGTYDVDGGQQLLPH